MMIIGVQFTIWYHTMDLTKSTTSTHRWNIIYLSSTLAFISRMVSHCNTKDMQSSIQNFITVESLSLTLIMRQWSKRPILCITTALGTMLIDQAKNTVIYIKILISLFHTFIMKFMIKTLDGNTDMNLMFTLLITTLMIATSTTKDHTASITKHITSNTTKLRTTNLITLQRPMIYMHI